MNGKLRKFLPVSLIFAAGLVFGVVWKTSVRGESTDDDRTFVYGIQAFNPRAVLEADHGPIVAHLSRSLGQPVRLEILERYEDLVGRLETGEVDLALLTESVYLNAMERRVPAKAVAMTAPSRKHGSSFTHIVTRMDSGIMDLASLKGRVVCFTGPNSDSGYVYPRRLLKEHGVDVDEDLENFMFVGGYVEALDALWEGRCDAAATGEPYLLIGEEKHPNGFRSLGSTPQASVAACVNESIPPQVADRIRKALLSYSYEMETNPGVPYTGWTGFTIPKFESR